MKHKETVDDLAVKDAAKIQRKEEKVDLPESEDPERYAQLKQLKKKARGKSGNMRKKEAREDRKRSENFIDALMKLLKRKRGL